MLCSAFCLLTVFGIEWVCFNARVVVLFFCCLEFFMSSAAQVLTCTDLILPLPAASLSASF